MLFILVEFYIHTVVLEINPVVLIQSVAYNLSRYEKYASSFYTEKNCWYFHWQRHVIQMYIILLISTENSLVWRNEVLPVGSNDLKVAPVLQVVAGMLF